MNTQEFVQNFVNLFDETDAAEISLSTEFISLDDLSSLISISFISMSDEEYNVKLIVYYIKAAHTVEDLYNVVKSRM